MSTTATATMPCARCGTPTPYEPIHIGGRDFGRLIGRFCESCEDIQKRQEAEEAAERREEEFLSAIRAIIPPDLRQTSIHHPEFNTNLWAAVSGWSVTQNQWLGLIGPSGRCKTRVLALKANKLIRQGFRVFWTDAVRFQTYAEDRSARDSIRATLAAEHLAACRHSSVLIIDDIGKNTWGPSMERHFFSLLDHRKNHQLPILWSANCHPEEMAVSLSKHNAAPIIGRLIDRTEIIDLFASA